MVAVIVSWSVHTAFSESSIKKLKSLTETVAWNAAPALKTVQLMLSLSIPMKAVAVQPISSTAGLPNFAARLQQTAVAKFHLQMTEACTTRFYEVFNTS